MNRKIVFLSSMTIAAVLLFCASGHIGNQKAIAQGGFGPGFGGDYGGYGGDYGGYGGDYGGYGGDYGGYGGAPYVNCRIFIYSTGPCL
jgi:hypothetical protein